MLKQQCLFHGTWFRKWLREWFSEASGFSNGFCFGSMSWWQRMRLLARWHTHEQGGQRHQPSWDHWTRPSHSRISIAKGQLHQLYWLPPWWYPNERSRQCFEPPWDHGPWLSCSWLSFASLILCCSSWIPCGWHSHGLSRQPFCAGASDRDNGSGCPSHTTMEEGL